MKRTLGVSVATLIIMLLITAAPATAEKPAIPAWKAELQRQLPLLGHRNWVVVVDSAYPLQTSAGIKTVYTAEEQTDVVRTVLDEVDKAAHVRGIPYVDAELPYVPENRAAGITEYRRQLKKLLEGREVNSLAHEQIIAKLDEAGKTYSILVLKTTLTLPYTSVFIQLDCGYWSAEAEQLLRELPYPKTTSEGN